MNKDEIIKQLKNALVHTLKVEDIVCDIRRQTDYKYKAFNNVTDGLNETIAYLYTVIEDIEEGEE